MLPRPLPASFGPASNLFETFSLDSVDALEIVMALKRRYGVEFSQEDERNRTIFESVGSIAAYVESKRQASA
jgi:acyl carrier protein